MMLTDKGTYLYYETQFYGFNPPSPSWRPHLDYTKVPTHYPSTFHVVIGKYGFKSCLNPKLQVSARF